MSEVIESREIEDLMLNLNVGWVVSKFGGDPRTSYEVVKVLPDPIRPAVSIRSLETGTTLHEPVEKLLANGYMFAPPASAVSAAPATLKKEDSQMQEGQVQQSQTAALGGEMPGNASTTPIENPVSNANAPVDSNGASTGSAAGDAADDPAAILMSQWEAERNKVDEKFRQKIIDARRKSKSTSVRREEALTLMDGLRDAIRGNDIGMVDEDIDRAISLVVTDAIQSGAVRTALVNL
jgi:hypothetical protein